MKHYLIRFTGRPIGSLGINHGQTTRLVQAVDPDKARLQAYDTHEHIRGGLPGVAAEEVLVGVDPEAVDALD